MEKYFFSLFSQIISAIQYLVPNCIFYMSQSIPIFQHVLRQTSRIFRDIQYLLLGSAESTYNLFKHSPMYWPHSPTERNVIRREVELKNELRRWRLTPGSEFQDEFLHQISPSVKITGRRDEGMQNDLLNAQRDTFMESTCS